MTRINTNVSSSIAQTNLARSQAALGTALQRLSTGLRINVGKDDPAGLIASEALRGNITSIDRAIGNSERANQLIATADSALGQVSSLLNDIRGLVSEAANTGALSQAQIEANQLQVDSSLEAIDRIAKTTSFQGKKLLDGSLDFITTSNGAINTASTAKIANATATAGGGKIQSDATFANTTVSAAGTNNDIAITAKSASAATNGYTVTITSGATSGDINVSVGASTIEIQLTGDNLASAVIAALSASTAFDALFSASNAASNDGTGTISSGALPSAVTTSAGAAYGEINLTAVTSGSTANVTISVQLTTGSAAVAITGGTTLQVLVTANSTTAEVAQLISAQGIYTASISGASTGKISAGSTVVDVSGGADLGAIDIAAVTAGAGPNAYTVSVAVTTGSAAVALSGTVLEIQATAASTLTQIAGLISATGSFTATISGAGTGIVGGSSVLSNFTGGSTEDNLADVRIDQANFGTQSTIAVQVQIDTQATQGQLTFSGSTITSAVVLEVGGRNGFEVFNLGAGNTSAQIRDAVNLVSDATGVEASISGGNLIFKSTEYGSDAFASVRALTGTFSVTDAGGAATNRDAGSDVALRVNGITGRGQGLLASINTATLDLSFKVNENLSSGSTVNFDITGGGATFQLGPDVVSNQQARLGIQGVNTATLGGTRGTLFQIRTGGDSSLENDPSSAAAIVDQVITKVTDLRGRLGAFQKTTLETNIYTLTDTLSNLTEAQSTIRDADFAKESAALTRAQILVQSGTTVLTIANQNPQQVLALLR